jgi:hypothetical protein
VSATLGTQTRQSGLSDPQRTEKAGVDLPAGLFIGDFLNSTEKAVAGVVDDHVDPAEVIEGPRDRDSVRLRVGDVQRHRQHRVTILVSQRLDRGDVPGGGGYPIAPFKCRLCPDSAEATRSTGYEPHLARRAWLHCRISDHLITHSSRRCVALNAVPLLASGSSSTAIPRACAGAIIATPRPPLDVALSSQLAAGVVELLYRADQTRFPSWIKSKNGIPRPV